MSSTPQPYERQFDFETFSTTNPNDQQPGVELDGEFDAIKTSMGETQSRLGELQRDDGALRNQVVHKDALSATVRAMIAAGGTPRGDWATATAYSVSDLVAKDGATYIAVTAHTSGTFSTDLAAGKWLLLASPFNLASAFTQTFSGDGATTVFTLDESFTSIDELFVFVGGEYKRGFGTGPEVSLSSGNQITFSTAPALGTRNISVISRSADAATSAASALAAQQAAEAAQLAAELAETNAETAETNAETAADEAAASAAAAALFNPALYALLTGATFTGNVRVNASFGLNVAPSYDMHVRKDQNATTWIAVDNPNVGGAACAGFRIGVSSGSWDFVVNPAGFANYNAPANASLFFDMIGGTGGNLVFRSTNSYTQRLMVQGSTGYVGVGTKTPVAQLDVNNFAAKATVGSLGLAYFQSSDAAGSNPLALVIGLVGGASSSARYASIQASEIGLGTNELRLQPSGGAVVFGSGAAVFSEASAPSTPAADRVALYAKTDGKLYMKNDAGTETALGGGALELIATLTASGSASLDFSSFDPTKYSDYEFIIDGLAPATNAVNLLCRVSIDGGSSYRSTAGDYAWTYQAIADTTAVGTGSTSDTSMRLNASSIGNGTNQKIVGRLTLHAPDVGNVVMLTGRTHSRVDATSIATAVFGGQYRGTTDDVDGIRFLMSSGNIASGTIRVYGVKK